MPKAESKSKSKNAPKKATKKLNIKFKKPNWESIKESKVTRYSLIVLAVLVCFVIVDLGVQYLNNDYSVVVVNGTRVSQREYYYRLDQAYGSAIATQLIQEELIRQEAQSQGVVATEEEIQEEVDNIAEQLGGADQLDSSLEVYNLTMDDLKDQIEIDILSNKIIEPTIEYSEEDVQEFFEQYSEVIFAEDAANLEDGELLDYDTYRDETLEVYLSNEVENAKSSWLAEIEAEAKIQNNVTDQPKYMFLGATRNIISNIFDEANTNEGSEE